MMNNWILTKIRAKKWKRLGYWDASTPEDRKTANDIALKRDYKFLIRDNNEIN